MKRVIVVAVCGIGGLAPALAQDPPRFQYSPVARHLSDGRYRAEVWRRDLAKGQEELAWSNYEPHASPAKAMDDACTSLRKHFDASVACAQMSPDHKAAENAKEAPVSDPPAAAMTPKSARPRDGETKAPRASASVPEPNSIPTSKKAPVSGRPVVPIPKTATAPADQASNPEWKQWVAKAKRILSAPAVASASSNWGKDFWAHQSRWSGGGGEGGGGGGGDGGGGGSE